MLNSIPQELRKLTQFVGWKAESRGNGKLTKVPYDVKRDVKASCRLPDSWATFDEATIKLQKDKSYAGIGFVLTDDDPFCFIDLDKAQTPQDADFQMQLVDDFDSYAERSPSGQGLHIICEGQVPCGHRGRSCEIYSSSRYMTMTGDVYLDRPILPRSSKCRLLWEVLDNGRGGDTLGNKIDEPQTVEDFDVFNIAKSAENSEKFLSLWTGDIDRYHGGDHSRADFALINILAFYTKNRDQIKRLFRSSALGKRDKAKREPYLDQMISKSFDGPVTIDMTAIQNKMANFVLENKNNYQEQLLKQKPLFIPYNPYEHAPIIRDESGRIVLPHGKPEPKPIFALPPGMTGEIAKFIYDQSFKPVQEIAIMGALALMAGFAGKAYNISGTGLNLYLLLLAGTGRGKEEIAKGVNKLIKSTEYKMPTIRNFVGPGDLASGQGLLRFVNDHPTKSFVSIFGEFGHMLKRISNPNATSADNMTLKVMLDMYSKSGAPDTINATAYSDADRNIDSIHAPGFSMVGETQPKWFYSNIDDAMIASGFLPRFCMLHFEGDRPESNFNSHKVIPSDKLIEKLSGVATVAQQQIANSSVVNVTMSEEVEVLHKRLCSKYDDLINKSGDNASAEELWNRAHLKTLKVAALLAVGVNWNKPVINIVCWNWAVKFIEYGTKHLIKQFDDGVIGSDSKEQEQVRALISIMSDYCFLSFENCCKFVPDFPIELWNTKVIPHAYLQKRTSRLTCFRKDKLGARNAFRRAMQIMIDNNELTMMPKGSLTAKYDYGGTCYCVGDGLLAKIEAPMTRTRKKP